MKQWLRGGANNTPHHASGTRATDRALSHTRSLTAATVAVAMMATVAVTALLPTYNAKADEIPGSIYKPANIHMGDGNASTNDVDTGLATFVGRDFYVGKPKTSNKLGTADTQQLADDSIEGSWAAEMEGQTFVRGRYMQRAKKGFFTIGTVAFGAQYLPANDAKVLVVENANTAFNSSVASVVQAWPSDESGITSSQGGGILQATRKVNGVSTGTSFGTLFAGACTQVWGSTGNCLSDKVGVKRNSVFMYGGNGQDNRPAGWNTTDFSTVTDGQGNTINDYAEKIMTPMSSAAAGIKSNGTVTIGNAPAQSDYVHYKYDYYQYAENATDITNGKPYSPTKTGSNGDFNTYKATMKLGSDAEKLITFTGTGKASDTTQVFTLTAQQVNALNNANTSIWFRNIPDNASIIINVSGSEPISMRTGWRFWWGGNATQDADKTDPITAKATDISNGYAINDGTSETYAAVSQKILWNFTDTTSLTINGAKASNVTLQSKHANVSSHDWYVNPNEVTIAANASVDDDPSAAMLGSIVVPKGSFESHVTTNGRVYVGQDYMMHNPAAASVNNSFKSASIIDMDQERHNFPWTASYSEKSVRLSWKKADSAGTALGGTSWQVYGKLEDAKNEENALLSVTDNGSGDEDTTVGTIRPSTALTANALYYVRETGTGNASYKLNTNIYHIKAGDGGQIHSTITAVYDSAGNDITSDVSKNLLFTNTDKTSSIVNESMNDLEWQKTDANDATKRLAGSEWQLTKYTDANKQTVAEGWPKDIKDSVITVNGVKITYNGTTYDGSTQTEAADIGSVTAGTVFDLGHSVDPSEAAQDVTWTSDHTAYATVDANTGRVTPVTNSGENYVTITACSVADATKCASVKFKVTGQSVENSLDVTPDTASVKVGESVQLTANRWPTDATVTWASDKPGVATVDSNGKVTGVSVGTARITATGSNGKSDYADITVTGETYDLYFKKSLVPSWNQYWLKYEKATDTKDWTGDMQSTYTCGDYVRFSVLKSDVNTSGGFKFGGGSGYSVSMYALDTQGAPFSFTGNNVQVVNSYNDYRGFTVPPDCAASSNSVSRVARRAKASARRAATVEASTTPSANGMLTDADPSVGGFRITKLESGTYVLKETKAPNGYKLSATEYTITIADGKLTWNPALTDSKISNDRETGAITWNKVSSDTANTNKLSGSEWKLTKTKNFVWKSSDDADATKPHVNAAYEDITTDKQVPIAITDCKAGAGNKCTAPTDADGKAQTIYDVDPVEGQFKLEGLDWGTYTLEETKSPDGYDLDSTVRTFAFGPKSDSDGTGNWYSNSVAESNTDKTGTFTTADKTYDSDVFDFAVGGIKNRPGVVLPATGGEGNMKIFAAAIAAAMVAVVAACMALKVRRRQ